jgi:hypothetical protein
METTDYFVSYTLISGIKFSDQSFHDTVIELDHHMKTKEDIEDLRSKLRAKHPNLPRYYDVVMICIYRLLS